MFDNIKNLMIKWKLLDPPDEDEMQEEKVTTYTKKAELPQRETRETREREPQANLPKRGKIVNIHTTTQLKVVVVHPETFEDSKEIADHLKTKKPIVVNLEKIDSEVAKRIIDFLSGAVYSLDGNIQKISKGIFLIVPYNMGIMGDFKDELRNKVVFPF